MHQSYIESLPTFSLSELTWSKSAGKTTRYAKSCVPSAVKLLNAVGQNFNIGLLLTIFNSSLVLLFLISDPHVDTLHLGCNALVVYLAV